MRDHDRRMREAGNRKVVVWCPGAAVQDIRDAASAMADPEMPVESRHAARELVAQAGAIWRLGRL